MGGRLGLRGVRVWGRYSVSCLWGGCEGDRDVVEAHVDSCLAHEGRLEEERRVAEEDVDISIDGDGDGNMRLRATDGANLRGRSAD
jgi:hypothetical protein